MALNSTLFYTSCQEIFLRGEQAFGWGLFLSGCFLAAARELMQRLAKGKTQKHQNRLMPWWSFAPKKNFFFSFCPL